jgi:cytoskeleton protein RodZ
MASTGSILRELRQQRGVCLEEVARSTRISARVLAALEADDLAALPTGPFAKGFIRAYCQALDVPPDDALAQYSLATGVPAAPHQPSAPRQAPAVSRAPVLVSFGLLVGLGLALAAVTLALKPNRDDAAPRPAQQGNRALSTAPWAEAAGPPAESVAQVSPPPGTVLDPSLAASAASPRAAVSASRLPTVPKTKSYRLVARASQSTRIRVRLDGRRIVEETIPPGAVREWISNRPFELRIVNAGGVTLELNGRVLPPLGARGTTIHRLVLPTESR